MRGFRGGIGGLAGFSMGAILASLAGAFGIGGRDFRASQIPAQGFKAPFAKRSGRQRSSSRAETDRLPLDRASNVRKIQRWINNGTMHIREPSERAITRHKVRRVERQRAANLSQLATE